MLTSLLLVFFLVFGSATSLDDVLLDAQSAVASRSPQLAQGYLETFLRNAPSTHSQYQWALQSQGAVFIMKGEYDKGIELSSKAIEINGTTMDAIRANLNIAMAYDMAYLNQNLDMSSSGYYAEKIVRHISKACQVRCSIFTQQERQLWIRAQYILSMVHRDELIRITSVREISDMLTSNDITVRDTGSSIDTLRQAASLLATHCVELPYREASSDLIKEWFQLSLDWFKWEAKPHELMGIYYTVVHELDHAEAAYKKSLSILLGENNSGPNRITSDQHESADANAASRVYFNMGFIYMLRGQSGHARRVYEKALSLIMGDMEDIYEHRRTIRRLEARIRKNINKKSQRKTRKKKHTRKSDEIVSSHERCSDGQYSIIGDWRQYPVSRVQTIFAEGGSFISSEIHRNHELYPLANQTTLLTYLESHVATEGSDDNQMKTTDQNDRKNEKMAKKKRKNKKRKRRHRRRRKKSTYLDSLFTPSIELDLDFFTESDVHLVSLTDVSVAGIDQLWGFNCSLLLRDTDLPILTRIKPEGLLYNLPSLATSRGEDSGLEPVFIRGKNIEFTFAEDVDVIEADPLVSPSSQPSLSDLGSSLSSELENFDLDLLDIDADLMVVELSALKSGTDMFSSIHSSHSSAQPNSNNNNDGNDSDEDYTSKEIWATFFPVHIHSYYHWCIEYTPRLMILRRQMINDPSIKLLSWYPKKAQFAKELTELVLGPLIEENRVVQYTKSQNDNCSGALCDDRLQFQNHENNQDSINEQALLEMTTKHIGISEMMYVQYTPALATQLNSKDESLNFSIDHFDVTERVVDHSDSTSTPVVLAPSFGWQTRQSGHESMAIPLENVFSNRSSSSSFLSPSSHISSPLFYQFKFPQYDFMGVHYPPRLVLELQREYMWELLPPISSSPSFGPMNECAPNLPPLLFSEKGTPVADAIIYVRRTSKETRRVVYNEELLLDKLNQAFSIRNKDRIGMIQQKSSSLVLNSHFVAFDANCSVREQIQLFRRARVVIGAHGGGLSNIVWAPRGSSLIELPVYPQVHNYFAAIAHALSIHYHPVHSVHSTFKGDWNLDEESVAAIITELCAALLRVGSEGGPSNKPSPNTQTSSNHPLKERSRPTCPLSLYEGIGVSKEQLKRRLNVNFVD